jgi:hypothetical protein
VGGGWRGGGGGDLVEGDGHRGEIAGYAEQDKNPCGQDEFHAYDGKEEEDEDRHAAADSINDIRLYAAEDLAAAVDSSDDGRNALLQNCRENKSEVGAGQGGGKKS